MVYFLTNSCLFCSQCTDPNACDICGDGDIADDSKVITITIPGTGEMETATCGEWFLFGCLLVDPSVCAAYQNALAECCKSIAKQFDQPDNEVLVVVDNTYMGPLWQHPLKHGADLVIYSATKYIGGHSDIIAGATLGRKELMKSDSRGSDTDFQNR